MDKAIDIAVTHETTRRHLASVAAREPADNFDAVTSSKVKTSVHRLTHCWPKPRPDCRLQELWWETQT